MKGKSIMKKILSTAAAIIIAASMSVSVLADVTLYSADGRMIRVPDNQVAAYEAVSWFTAPPVIMYAEDGRTIQISGDKVEAYKAVGWYTAKPVKMYAADGRTIVVSGDEVEAYKKVGWSLPAMVTMHAADGRTISIPENQIEAYKAVGWYTSVPVTMYAAAGRTVRVSKADVEAYKAVGWFTEPQTSYQAANAPTVAGQELTPEQIYAQCSPAVFYIEVYNASGYATSSGSGFFIDSDGTAVTNYHVIEDAATAKVQLAGTGAVHDILGVYDYSKENDWAVIKVNCSGNPVLGIGDAATVIGGATIYTIGSPEGFQNTISQGIISNPERIEDGVKYIQITAPVSHGSSGGALINKYGKVIGITSAMYSEGQNLNFALPISVISGYRKGYATPLINFGKPTYTQPTYTAPTYGSVPYYANFYGVPDFGRITGATLKTTGSVTGAYGYFYYPDFNTDKLNTYEDALEQSGFNYNYDFKSDDGFTQLVYTNYRIGYSVTIGLTGSGLILVMITRA